MRSRWNGPIVLVYMLLSVVVLVFIGTNTAGPCPPIFNRCQQFQVQFANASGLLYNDDARIAGIKAGKVQAVHLDGKMAVVTVQIFQDIQSRHPIYRGTHAVVRSKSLLGETYVEFDRGERIGRKL